MAWTIVSFWASTKSCISHLQGYSSLSDTLYCLQGFFSLCSLHLACSTIQPNWSIKGVLKIKITLEFTSAGCCNTALHFPCPLEHLQTYLYLLHCSKLNQKDRLANICSFHSLLKSSHSLKKLDSGCQNAYFSMVCIIWTFRHLSGSVTGGFINPQGQTEWQRKYCLHLKDTFHTFAAHLVEYSDNTRDCVYYVVLFFM